MLTKLLSVILKKFGLWPKNTGTLNAFLSETGKLFANVQGRNDGGQGEEFSGAESLRRGAGWLRRAPQSTDNVISTFFNTVHLLPNNLNFEHGAPK